MAGFGVKLLSKLDLLQVVRHLAHWHDVLRLLRREPAVIA
jgi:hypothetical protein